MTGQQTWNGRIEWIDALKGLTVLLVALHHSMLAVYSITPVESSTILDTAIQVLNSRLELARMPAFFLSGGLVLASLKDNKTKWLMNKRLPFMIWIIFVWTSISLLSESAGLYLYPWESYPYFEGKEYFYAPYGNLWFIYALLILSCFAVSLAKLDTRHQILLSLSASLLLAYINSHYHFSLAINHLLLFSLAYKGIPFFMLGFIFRNHVLSALSSNTVIYSLTFLMALLFITSSILFSNYSPYQILIFKYLPATSVFVSLVLIFCRRTWFVRFFKMIGKASLEIFLLHQFFIAIFIQLFNSLGLDTTELYKRLLLILTPLVLCVLFSIFFLDYLKVSLFRIPPIPLYKKLKI